MPISGSNEAHVAVLAFPFGTHAAPLLSLVCRLAAGSPDVRFSFLNTAKSNDKVFSRIKVGDHANITPCNVNDGIPQGHVFSCNPLESVMLFIEAMPENFKDGVEEAVAKSGTKITCLLTDAFFWFAGDMAAEMGIPWVALWTAAPFSISVHLNTDVIRRTLIGQVFSEGIVHGDLESPFARMLHSMGQTIPRAAAIALNSFEEIDPIITDYLKSKLKPLLNVGPFNLSSPPASFSDENGCIPWLDKHRASSVAYLCFGTILTPPLDELMALAEALESKNVPFLWSLRENSKLHLPEEFLRRTRNLGKVVPWSPQLQVLEHSSVGVFVTHAGWNSVLESIAGGVPMICRPFFADQPLNSRFIEDIWKIGVSVEGGVFTKFGTMKALDQILGSEEGKRGRDNIKILKQAAANAVESDGSSTKNFRTLLELVTACN